MNNDQTSREIGRNLMTIVVSAKDFTLEKFFKAIKTLLTELSGEKIADVKGKQSLEKIIGSGAALEEIEVSESNIKGFERFARKYDIDFALKKTKIQDLETGKNKYIVFFKAKKFDNFEKAFWDFIKVGENDKNRGKSVRKDIGTKQAYVNSQKHSRNVNRNFERSI